MFMRIVKMCIIKFKRLITCTLLNLFRTCSGLHTITLSEVAGLFLENMIINIIYLKKCKSLLDDFMLIISQLFSHISIILNLKYYDFISYYINKDLLLLLLFLPQVPTFLLTVLQLYSKNVSFLFLLINKPHVYNIYCSNLYNEANNELVL